MVQSQTPVISVKIPINWEAMTKRSRQRLTQIMGRDTRVIRALVGIIEANELDLLRGRNRKRIDESKLHAITMTAVRTTCDTNQRLVVKYDLKARFPRASANELTECRRAAVANYESYLALRAKKGRHASRPCEINRPRRIPRWVYIPYRAKLVEHRTRAARWWINLRDSLDSTPEGRKTHDRLLVPLKTSPFHLSQLQRGNPKALQVFKDRESKWWTTVAVRLSAVETSPSNQLPAAILGIDLGINRAVCTTLLTPKKVSETRYFYQEDKAKLMVKYDELVAQLQQEFDTRKNNGLHYGGVLTKLKTLRLKREKVAKEHDRLLVSQLLAYVKTLNEEFELYIALGRLKGIRGSARKGNYKGRKFRGMVHRWSFSRITLSLKHGLSQLGWKVEGKSARFQTVPEAWTSILCWKCGRKGIRPKQSLFVCHTCGFRTNADRNGSLNIARRLIRLTPALRDEKGLGRWAVPEKAPAPKVVRKIRSSKRKSPLPSKDDTSHLGESAAVHSAQLSLLDFGDGVQKSDDDLAVVKTVEKLSATGDDAIRIGQKREAKTTGGIQSR